MSRSKRIADQLGMSMGTAAHRLRKKILFSLLVKLKENVCFVCKAEIIKVDDLSLEHKKPWEGRSVELFWDLNNIAFSHLKCNRPHKFGDGPTPACIHGTYAEWYRGCKCEPCCQAMRDYKKEYRDRSGIH